MGETPKDKLTNIEEGDKLLTVEELAAYLTVKPSWVYYSDLPKIKCGKYNRYWLSKALRHLEGQQGNN